MTLALCRRFGRCLHPYRFISLRAGPGDPPIGPTMAEVAPSLTDVYFGTTALE